MCSKTFVLFAIVYSIFARSEVNSWRCDYTYVKIANGYFKYHNIPASWRVAWLRCQDEGAILASPYPGDVRAGLLNLMSNPNSSRLIFTGIHATFSKGDYNTIDGIPLSKIPTNWMENEPDNNNNVEECLIFTSDGLMVDKECNKTYPYFCYKKQTEDDTLIGPCGTTHPGYEYSNVTGSCYKFHRVPRNWFRAHMACSAEGGHLAIINSDEESQAIKDLWAKTQSKLLLENFGRKPRLLVSMIGLN